MGPLASNALHVMPKTPLSSFTVIILKWRSRPRGAVADGVSFSPLSSTTRLWMHFFCCLNGLIITRTAMSSSRCLFPENNYLPTESPQSSSRCSFPTITLLWCCVHKNHVRNWFVTTRMGLGEAAAAAGKKLVLAKHYFFTTFYEIVSFMACLFCDTNNFLQKNNCLWLLTSSEFFLMPRLGCRVLTNSNNSVCLCQKKWGARPNGPHEGSLCKKMFHAEIGKIIVKKWKWGVFFCWRSSPFGRCLLHIHTLTLLVEK